MITGMRELCKKANVITPNLTEAAFLLDTAPSPHTPPAEAIEWCKALNKLGTEYVIIILAPSGNEKKVATLAYNKNDERLWRVSSDYVAASYPGTGDAFASVITGCLLNGDSLPEAIERAVHFINMGIKATFGYAHNPLDGMNQEKVLHYLNESLPRGDSILEKDFFDVFPNLKVKKELEELLDMVFVTRVSCNPSKTHIWVYIKSERWIHKKHIFALEEQIERQIFAGLGVTVTVIEKFHLSGTVQSGLV